MAKSTNSPAEIPCNYCQDDIYENNLKDCIEFIQTKKCARLVHLFKENH